MVAQRSATTDGHFVPTCDQFVITSFGGHENSVVGVMKMGNIVPRLGFEPTSLALQASVLPLHHVVFPDITAYTHAHLSL